MVLLHMKTDNALNTTLAKFDSLYHDSFIQFSNIDNNIYLSGIANDNFKIYNPTITNDNGLIYNNNKLTVKSHNTQIIKYDNFTVFPNDFTPINSYEFFEYNNVNQFGFSNCFDLNSLTYWQSDSIYLRGDGNINLTNIANIDPYNFQNTNSRGYWVKIKFPYQIIPIGIYISSLKFANEPVFFDVFVSNDNINWTKILVVNTSTVGNDFFFRENTTLYLYVAIVITKIITNTTSTADVIQFFRVSEIKIYSMPILHLDNNIKIVNNNLFNLNTVSASRLVLNNTTITSVNDLGSYVTTQAVQSMVNLYNIYWKNIGTTGYLNSNIVNRISINSNVANSTLDINGDIAFNQRSLNKSFKITNKGGVFDISSSNVYVGKVNCSNNIINYFKLSFILFEYDKYYFQTIDINGYSAFNSNLNIYWNTSFDSSYLKQRVVDVKYQLQEYNNNTSILFYFKYNPDINITSAVTIDDLNSDYINNIIYSDLFATSHSNNINFLIRDNVNNIINLNNDVYSNTYLINQISLNKSSNYSITINTSNINANYININDINGKNLNISNINTSKIILSNNQIINSNFLILDSKKEIIDSGISSNTLSRFINLPSISNKILGTNSNGSIGYLEQSSLLLSNISYQANVDNKILISSNNYFEGFTISKNNLSNLNRITDTPNAFVIIDDNNNLKTTSSLPLSNIANILNLFKYNETANNGIKGVVCNSNIILSNLSVNNDIYIGNSFIITSNNKFNNILINNREIADDK